MRAYATVRGIFWSRGSGKKLRGDPEAQVLAMYLMSCTHGTACGIFHVALPTIAHEVGFSIEKVREVLSRIQEIAEYDEEEELCWVPNCAREQIGERLKWKDNKRPKLESELRQFGQHRFVSAFVEKYSSVYEMEMPKWCGDNEASKGLGRGSEGGVDPPSTDQDSTVQVGGSGGRPTDTPRPPDLKLPDDTASGFEIGLPGLTPEFAKMAFRVWMAQPPPDKRMSRNQWLIYASKVITGSWNDRKRRLEIQQALESQGTDPQELKAKRKAQFTANEQAAKTFRERQQAKLAKAAGVER